MSENTYWIESYSGLGTPHYIRNLELRSTHNVSRYVPDTWKVADNLYAELVKQFGVADTRTFKNLRGTESTGTENDHLTGLHNGFLYFTAICTVTRRDVCNTDGLVVLVEEDAGASGVTAQVEVALDVHDTVNVSCEAL